MVSIGLSRIVTEPAIRNPSLMPHKVAIWHQTLSHTCLLPFQSVIEEKVRISKNTRIEQSGLFRAKEIFVVSQQLRECFKSFLAVSV